MVVDLPTAFADRDVRWCCYTIDNDHRSREDHSRRVRLFCDRITADVTLHLRLSAKNGSRSVVFNKT